MTTPDIYFALSTMCCYIALSLVIYPSTTKQWFTAISIGTPLQEAVLRTSAYASWAMALHKAIQILNHL